MPMNLIELMSSGQKQEEEEVSTEEKPVELNQKLFFDVIKSAYEKGNNDEITIKKLMDDLIIELKMITG